MSKRTIGCIWIAKTSEPLRKRSNDPFTMCTHSLALAVTLSYLEIGVGEKQKYAKTKVERDR